MNLNIKTANRLGDVKEYYFSTKLREIAELRTSGKEIINLGIGSPDLAPHPSVVQALHDASSFDHNHAYQSYKGIPELRKAFAQWYDQYFNTTLNPATEVLPLMGSKEGIMHISMSFLNPGDKVLVPNPGYPAYAAVAKLTGAELLYYDLKEENGWLPDLDKIAKEDLSKVKLMWMNYPNMPTGVAAHKDFMERIIQFVREHQILLVNDNPYAFILNDEPSSILSIDGAMEVAMELNSLSKAQNMAGWRVGVLVGRQDLVETVLRFKSNMDSGMFKPVQLAAIKALGLGKEWYAGLNEIYQKRQSVAFRILDALHCSYSKEQQGLFVWGKIPKTFKDGYELSDQILYEKDIFITPGGIFGSNGNQYIRISLCSPKEILEQALLTVTS